MAEDLAKKIGVYERNRMLITRDINIQATICLWLEVEKKRLFIDAQGEWQADPEDEPIIELSAEEFKKVFVGEPPKKGFIGEVKLQFETTSGIPIEGR